MKKRIGKLITFLIAICLFGSAVALAANIAKKGEWKNLKENYGYDTQSKVLSEDDGKNILKKEEAYNKGVLPEDFVEENLKDFKLNTNKELLEKEQKQISIDYNGKKYEFEYYEENGKKYVKGKNLDVLNNKDHNKFIIYNTYDGILQVDIDNNKISKLTKDEVYGIAKDEYINNLHKKYQEEPFNLFWASEPSISPDGDNIVYYSNKSIVNDESGLKDGLWLYDFKKNSDELIISYEDKNILPQTYWIDKNQFIFSQFKDNGLLDCYLYDIVKNEIVAIPELTDIATILQVKDQYIAYLSTSMDEVFIYDLNKGIKTSFAETILPSYGIHISDDGNVVVRDNMNYILVLDFDTSDVRRYEIPALNDSITTIYGWLSKKEIIINIDTLEEQTTWILTDEGGME